MRRLSIPENVLRDLVARMPFYEIARLYKCDTRTLGHIAAGYGLTSTFKHKRGTAEEAARILALAGEGWSVRKIAKHIERSQDFVARQLREARSDPDAEDDSDESDMGFGSGSQEGWPVPEIAAADALNGRHFEDVSEDALLRECPPGRPVLNGNQLASVGRLARRSSSRSTADLCVAEPPMR